MPTPSLRDIFSSQTEQTLAWLSLLVLVVSLVITLLR
jgi:hypothetical protein